MRRRGFVFVGLSILSLSVAGCIDDDNGNNTDDDTDDSETRSDDGNNTDDTVEDSDFWDDTTISAEDDEHSQTDSFESPRK